MCGLTESRAGPASRRDLRLCLAGFCYGATLSLGRAQRGGRRHSHKTFTLELAPVLRTASYFCITGASDKVRKGSGKQQFLRGGKQRVKQALRTAGSQSEALCVLVPVLRTVPYRISANIICTQGYFTGIILVRRFCFLRALKLSTRAHAKRALRARGCNNKRENALRAAHACAGAGRT